MYATRNSLSLELTALHGADNTGDGVINLRGPFRYRHIALLSVASINLASPETSSNNPVNPLRNHVADDAKPEQAPCYAPEPGQVALVLLSGHPNVHAPQASDDVHRQHNRAEDSELTKHIGRLFLSRRHSDVDLGKVVGMRPSKNPVRFGQLWIGCHLARSEPRR